VTGALQLLADVNFIVPEYQPRVPPPWQRAAAPGLASASEYVWAAPGLMVV